MDSTTGKQSERINHVEALDGVVKATLGCPCETIFSAAFNSTLLFDVRRPVRRFRRFFRPRAPLSRTRSTPMKNWRV
jgi:hypothetical protein